MFLIQSALNMEASSRFLNQSLIDRHRDSLNKVEGPANKDDLKQEEDTKDSALGSMGLKPKIVH